MREFDNRAATRAWEKWGEPHVSILQRSAESEGRVILYPPRHVPEDVDFITGVKHKYLAEEIMIQKAISAQLAKRR